MATFGRAIYKFGAQSIVVDVKHFWGTQSIHMAELKEYGNQSLRYLIMSKLLDWGKFS